MNNILHISLEQIAKISILLNPIIPSSSLKIIEALNISKKNINLSFLDGNKIFNDKIKIKEVGILFKKIT